MTAVSLPPDALRRTIAAELRGAVMHGSRTLAPGLALGLLAVAALLERRTALDGDEVDRLCGAVLAMLERLIPGRMPALIGVAAVLPLRFGRAEPVRVAR